MSYVYSYWLDPEPDGPYSSFLNIMQSYLHPDSYYPEDLQEEARQTDSPTWAKFKSDFREIIADPTVLPEHALFTAAGYEDGTDEAFLARVWREIYGDESPSAEQVQASPES